MHTISRALMLDDWEVRSHTFYDGGEPAELQMNRLSLKNNRLKFKTAGKLPIVLEEFIEYTPI